MKNKTRSKLNSAEIQKAKREQISGISIVVPAFNEEKKISKTLDEIREFLKKNNLNNFEIIVVDDGSTDNTAMEAKQPGIRLLRNKKNRGKGYSVKKGVLASKKEIILFTDVDLSTPLIFLNNFLQYIKDYDIVIGSRNLPESNIKSRGLIRYMLGTGFAGLVSFILQLDISDSQCGFKLFKRDCAIKVFSLQKIEGWTFDAELLAIAKALGFKIKECPVNWDNDKDSKVKGTDIAKMLLDLIIIRNRVKRLKVVIARATANQSS